MKKLVKESLNESYSALEYLQTHKEEVKQVLRDYFLNFVNDGEFDMESYEESAMEGEMV